MRTLFLPFAAWAGVLQTIGTPTAIGGDPAHLIGLAGVLGSATVLVYRLGLWRQDMDTTRNGAVAEIKRYREENAANFDRIERRLEAIDHLVTESSELRFKVARWQERTHRRLDRLEQAADQ